MFKVEGYLTIRSKGIDKTYKNLVLSGGLTKLVGLLAGQDRGTVEVAIGTGTSNPAMADTTLSNMTSFTATSVTVNEEFYKVEVEYEVPLVTTFNGNTINEMGLVIGGTLFSRVKLEQPIHKTVDNQYSGIWAIQITRYMPPEVNYVVDENDNPVVDQFNKLVVVE